MAVSMVATGCGGSGGKSSASPEQELRQAQQTLNATPALRFELTSQKMSSLRSGTGDMARPDSIQGTFLVAVDGFPLSVKAIATGGKFYAILPGSSSYKEVDPKEFGLGNPATLIDPQTGVSRLLTEASGTKSLGSTRLNGEVLDQFQGTVPGTDITAYFPDAAPSDPVTLVFALNPSSHQVRRVTVTGPLASAGTTSSYQLTLTDYGEHVTITAPS